jgi:myo-inositol-1(or 4)-monophosphatase
MHQYLNIAIKAARLAGKVVIDAMLHASCSDVTKKIEEAIVNTILRAYPQHNITSTSNIQQIENSSITWVIDPLNGKINFLKGLPLFAISIAVMDAASIEHAVVYNPAADELYTASKGSGTQLNNRKVRCGNNIKIAESLLALEVGLLNKFLENFNINNGSTEPNSILVPTNLRYIGCPSLNLAFVAAGRLDGYCGNNLQPYEIAAGILLAKESGAYTTDFNGKADFMLNGDVISANNKVHPKLLELLQ